MKPPKILIAAALASIITLTSGCSLLPPPISKRLAPTTTNQFKQDDNSYAMNVLSAAWGNHIPFNIEDADTLKDANGVSGKTIYGSQIAMGALAGGFSGGLTGLLFAASMDASTPKTQDYFQAISWVPAKGRDINNFEDRKLITDELNQKFFKPMYKDFFKASQEGVITTSTKSTFNYKGKWCSLTDPDKQCSMFLPDNSIAFVGYADKQHGLPFSTNSNEKYIMTRIHFVPAIMRMMKYNKKDNLLFYVPPINYFAKFDKIQMKGIPYIQSTTGSHFFARNAY